MANKNFRSKNPALSYLSQKEEIVQEEQASTLPNHTEYSENIRKKETKSKRMNLLIQPTLSQNIAKIAALEQTSSNALIVQVLHQYVETQKDALEKYDRVFSKG